MGFPDLDFGAAHICFNVQNIADISFPLTSNKVVLTYHTEYVKHVDLLNFFLRHQNTQFLLLTDCNIDPDFKLFPNNVTLVTWLTWHHQIDTIIDHFGINLEISRPQKKISSLSYQHEFHKAAITAFLLKNVPACDRVISWWNVQSSGRLYYLDHDYHMPDQICNYVLDPDFQGVDSIELDHFENIPINNSNWRHPAYIDCLWNCTNESVYNDFCQIDLELYKLPYPYFTEKTWKPLLAGRPFMPVGQSKSLVALQKLGLRFMNVALEIDNVEYEFDRIIKIYDTIDLINKHSIDDLFDQSLDTVRHNISWIHQRHFFAECEKQNHAAKPTIQQWIDR